MGILADTDTSNSAPVKDRHDYLVALFKESRYGLVDFGFKQTAVITLLIGWIVTSDKPANFVHANHSVLAPVATVTLVLYFCFFVYWTLTYRYLSRFACTGLLAMSYLPADFYAPLRVTDKLVWTFFVMHGATCASLIAYIFFV